MNVNNAVYREIEPRWDEITLPLKAGTPMSKSGKITNNANAVGIVPQTITVKPVLPAILVLVGGSVSLEEVNAEYGEVLADEAMQAMRGISFYGVDGTPAADPSYGSGKGAVMLYKDNSGYLLYKSGGTSADRVLWADFIDLVTNYSVRVVTAVALGESTYTTIGECMAPMTSSPTYVSDRVLIDQSFTKDEVTYAWGIALVGISRATVSGKYYAKFSSEDTYLFGVPYPASDGGGSSDNPNEPTPSEDPIVG